MRLRLGIAALAAATLLAPAAGHGSELEVYSNTQLNVQTQWRGGSTTNVVPLYEFLTLTGREVSIPGGQLYFGCRFPARQSYRREIGEAGLRVGDVLSREGVIGRFGIDFVVRKRHDGWDVFAIEINLRKGGTTHPFLALQFLTGGALDAATGLFMAPSGHAKFYRSTDNLWSARYRGLLPEDLIEILTQNGLHYSPMNETGVLFHMIGALSQYGKLGLTAIGNSRDEAESLYASTLRVLDHEAVYRKGDPIDAVPGFPVE